MMISFTVPCNIGIAIAVLALLLLSLRKKEYAGPVDKLTGKLTGWTVVLALIPLIVVGVSFVYQKQIFAFFYSSSVETTGSMYNYTSSAYAAVIFVIALLARKGLTGGDPARRSRAGVSALTALVFCRVLRYLANLYEMRQKSYRGGTAIISYTAMESFYSAATTWFDLLVLVLLAVAAGMAIAGKKQAEKETEA